MMAPNFYNGKYFLESKRRKNRIPKLRGFCFLVFFWGGEGLFCNRVSLCSLAA